eukprot:TRINITY_DN2922_c0_g1_i3.p1 TRINITY_DN2922_c0_g1~~TRINITY_DN2922_c0_g1_i3.p1  ORF type:complete len:118 (-),score=11.29 TRINITY_DN2922_c0_g1_i3:155-508(-)
MFAASLPKASLATLSNISLTRVGSVAASRVFLSTTRANAKPNVPAGFAAIKERQKTFNIDNGLRVHQRGGTMDKVLYNATLLLILVGAVEWVRVAYTLSFLPQNRKLIVFRFVLLSS